MEPLDPHVNPTMALRRMHRWRMALSGLVILAAGITLGIAGTLLVVKPAEPRPPDIDNAVAMTLMRFRGELNLTDEQVDRIRTILREHFEELEALRMAARPKIEQLLQDMKTQIGEVLTEQQQTDWEKLIARFEEEFQRGMRRRPGGPGGPGRPGDGSRGPGRGDWPRRPDGFGPGGEGRPWGPRPEGADPNGGRRMRRFRPDANDMSARPMDEGWMPRERPPEPNGLP